MPEQPQILTYRYRVKNLSGELNRMARAVNHVWNFANDTQKHALKWNKKWPSGYELGKLAAGTSYSLGLASRTIGAVCAQYERSRRQHRKPFLRYRGRKTLGWIPLRRLSLKKLPNGFKYNGKVYRIFASRELPTGAKIVDGTSFSQDARGRWYINIYIERPAVHIENTAAVGIDLGLKTFASLSDGTVIESPRHFLALEKRLAAAQRAGKRRQAKKVYAKIAARRRDHLHKASTAIAHKFGTVAVGNVNAAALKKVMGKSVSDAGWSDFRNMLRYKAIGRGGRYFEVNEANTTCSCSSCGSVSGPKGRKGLSVRAWVCTDCGEPHERDHNAAKNILRLGHQALSVGAAI